MTAPIKGCPQPDTPELVMRAHGYHYQEDEMSYRELTDKQVMAAAMDYQEANMSCYRAVIAADRALNAPADRDVMRAPEGWKWVPIEPTQAMADAGFSEYGDWRMHSDGDPGNRGGYKRLYKAMLAAAPTPPVEQQAEQRPVAHLRAKSSMSRWNSFEVCEPNDGNAIPVYTHTAPSLTELRDKVKELPDYRGVSWAVNRNDVLALIDKMGGTVCNE